MDYIHIINIIVILSFLVWIFLRFTKKKTASSIQSSEGLLFTLDEGIREEELLLFTLYEEMSQELNVFIDKHDFTIYTPNVGVFGENSTGKSTFLNALLGNKDEFKMGLGETTNQITVLYKNEKIVPLIASASIVESDDLRNSFKTFWHTPTTDIVQNSNENEPFQLQHTDRNYKKMDYKHLAYMNLFDIPGFGQLFSHDELATVIQEIDIVFWFIDASKGVKKDDKLFLHSIKGLDTKVIIVLNKIDAIVQNDEIEKLLKEISNEISKIKSFFQEEELANNLVAVFPFSATKSLVGSLKNENGAFKVIDKVIESSLLYTVFIQSYRGYLKNILDEKVDVNNLQEKILDILYDTKWELKNELKENISFGSSLNPFSSKNKEAEPIVLKYVSLLEKRLDEYNMEFVSQINLRMQNMLSKLNSFEAFGKAEKFNFELEKFDSLDVGIDLNSMAWNNFLGDSFAEEVADNFEKKIRVKINKQIPQIIKNYENNIASFQADLRSDAQNFAKKLDQKLLSTSLKIQEPLLEFLLKAIKNNLGETDNQMIEKILKTKM